VIYTQSAMAAFVADSAADSAADDEDFADDADDGWALGGAGSVAFAPMASASFGAGCSIVRSGGAIGVTSGVAGGGGRVGASASGGAAAASTTAQRLTKSGKISKDARGTGRGRPALRPWSMQFDPVAKGFYKIFPSYADTADMLRWGPTLVVCKSLIKGGGNGVYATVDIPAGSYVGWYRGVALDGAEFRAKYPRDDAEYVLELFTDALFVDAAPLGVRNFSAYINDFRGSSRSRNCFFTRKGAVRTLRHIAAGEELYLDYGEGYWDGRHEDKEAKAKAGGGDSGNAGGKAGGKAGGGASGSASSGKPGGGGRRKVRTIADEPEIQGKT